MFNRTNVKKLRTDLNTEFEKIGKKLGLTLNFGNITFDSSEVRFKLHIHERVAGASPEKQKMNADMMNFAKKCCKYNLMPSDYGKTFKSLTGKTFKIVGLNTRAQRYPIICEDVSTGKKYKIPAHQVQCGLEGLYN